MSVSNLAACVDAYNGNIVSLRASIIQDSSLVKQTDNNERSPLHWACSSGQVAVVKLLISNKAEVSHR